MIAHFVEATRPPVRVLADEEARALADLVARRRQIITMIVAERQRLGRTDLRRLMLSIDRRLAALQKELSDIDEAVRGSPVRRAREDLLTSTPGIGPPTARTLIAEMPELGRSTAAGSRRSPALLPGPDSPASGATKP